MFDREFGVGGGLIRGAIPNRLIYDVRHSRRAFGANGFYGNSPSKEWTDQTIASATIIGRPVGGWTSDLVAAYKNHGDHFRWDIARPGFAENQHRDNSVDVTAKAVRQLSGATFVIGASGGADVVRSNNLGDHSFNRAGVFMELTTPDPARRATYQLGLRADRYSTFGSNVSPTAGAAFNLGNGSRARASGGRAFRIPNFTELYYHDPANQGNADLQAEHGWTLDAGVDYAKNNWTFSATPFGRWDDNVIDWVRASPTDLWRDERPRRHDARHRAGRIAPFLSQGGPRARRLHRDQRGRAPRLLSETCRVCEAIPRCIHRRWRGRADPQCERDLRAASTVRYQRILLARGSRTSRRRRSSSRDRIC